MEIVSDEIQERREAELTFNYRKVRDRHLSVSQHVPEAHVLTPICALAESLLKGEVLPASLKEQRTHRRIRVRPVEHKAADDLDAGAKRDQIGWKPAGRMHERDEFGPRPSMHKADAQTRVFAHGMQGAETMGKAPTAPDTSRFLL
jgi:hypothetical protein